MSSAEPSGGALTAHEIRVLVQYGLAASSDTIPPATEIPLQVRIDTVWNSQGWPTLYAVVTVTNLSDRSLVGTTGGSCNWYFSAYDNPERTGEPLWTEEGRGCRSSALRLSLAAGATQLFPRRHLSLLDIVANRGPGTYYLAARLYGTLDDGDGPWGWLTERIPAGEVVLLPFQP